MEKTAILAPIGRVLLAFIFVVAGLQKLGDPAGSAAYIESGGLPGILVWPTIAVEAVGGALVAIGLFARPAAFLLAGFSVLAGVLYHLMPGMSMEGMAQQAEMITFMKNLAIAGGLLMITTMGPGPYSVGR